MSSAMRIRRSLFDRLLGAHQDVPEGIMPTYSLDQLRNAVAADLECLLNTRTALTADTALLGPQARRSVLSFGVPDFAARVLASSEDQRHIARSLAQAIEWHEPRLRRVGVDFQVDPARGTALHFTVRALLVVTPLKEGVSFDAVLMPAASRYHVTQSRFVSAA